MKVVTVFNELYPARDLLISPIGLVPTMGFLHEGHLSLVRKAKSECASVVVSIFVNPTQFGPTEDLAAYPRDLDRDIKLLEQVGVDLVWTPTKDQMYLPGHQTWVVVEEVTRPLEGSHRPGHFRGVTTIVAKLFNAIQPDRVYFGQKDAQQVAVIRQMILDLNYPIKLVVCPTVREPDGLAMSSRNAYLNTGERKAALILYRAISNAQKAYLNGERNAEKLRQIMRNTLQGEPLAKPQYVSCADRTSLLELETVTPGALLSLAVYIGKTRLIDNLVLE
jgi:pantoate--beta-alanine ligase